MSGDDDYEIPESGAVFTFGRSRFADNLSSHFFVRNDPVLEISCGDEHTALVCKSGRVFLFGRNDYGQLGFGHNKIVSKPSCLKYLKPFHSTHVACGKSHTIVSTACNRLFTFGCNSDGQLGIGDINDRLVPQMVTVDLLDEDKITGVAAGCHHSAFITEKGNVYLWGSNSDGQCGVEEESQLSTPRKIDFDAHITSISCGYYHTAFISLGSVYTFGEEDNGKLGHSRKEHVSTPEKIDLEENCVLVECGGSHTLVLTENGNVYAFGSNFSGQLGIGNFEAECSTPTRVEFPNQDDRVIYVSCGESHTAFVTEKGALYTCGDSRYGKLCNEDDSANVTSPTLIRLFENYFCTSVSCGGCHTMVLAKNPTTENEVIISNNKPPILPPLKVNKDISLFPTSVSESQDNEEEKTEDEQKNTEENEDFDNKSNTESNLNNEEVSSHVDEIYTEIEEIITERSENESKTVDENPESQPNDSNDNDLVVVRKESAIKKLLSVFRRKKSVSAILVNDETKGEEEIQTEDAPKVGGQQKSKACVVL